MLEPIAEKIIHRNQSAFIGGRNIMNNILALHEIVHETKRKKRIGVALKLDFEKAYDKEHWGFLMKCIKARGFEEVWCTWIESVLQGGTASLKLNDQICPYFQSYKGVRQGPPAPLLFNIVDECLTRLVLKAQSNGLVTGLISNLIPLGVVILQYVDDTILCLNHDFEKTRNMKLLLYLYEQMSGLKINFDKSEVLLLGGDDEVALTYAEIFNCNIGSFPLKYLGVPILVGRLHVIDWIKLEEKTAKKPDVWQGGSLSMGGRNELINSSLSNSSIYHMPMFLIPKTNIKSWTS
jgi:hypothetical protein